MNKAQEKELELMAINLNAFKERIKEAGFNDNESFRLTELWFKSLLNRNEKEQLSNNLNRDIKNIFNKL